MSASQTVRTADLSAEEICRLGQVIYDRDLKPRLEPVHVGEYVAIHVGSGDHFVSADEDEALDRALAAHPGEVFFMARIGFDYVDRLGAYLESAGRLD